VLTDGVLQAAWELSGAWKSTEVGWNVRSGCSVEQDMPVLEILRFRAVLQVLLQTAATLVAADWGDGRLVNHRVSAFRCHDELWSVVEARK
jgi:hypothetical protein